MPCALPIRSEEHTSELQSHDNLVCRLLLEKTKKRSQPRTRPRAPHPLPPVPHRPRPQPLSSRTQRCALGDPRQTPGCGGPAFFFNDTATTEIYTLSLHDALPI